MKKTLGGLLMPIVLTACGLSNLDRPASREEDNWIKPGFTRQDVERVLYKECGFAKRRENIMFQEEADRCMLDKGFQFVDDAWDGSVCNREPRKSFPSCRSLRK